MNVLRPFKDVNYKLVYTPDNSLDGFSFDYIEFLSAMNTLRQNLILKRDASTQTSDEEFFLVENWF